MPATVATGRTNRISRPLDAVVPGTSRVPIRVTSGIWMSSVVIPVIGARTTPMLRRPIARATGPITA